MATKIRTGQLQEKVLGYAEITANQTSITTVADVTGLSVTVNVPVGGRKIKISSFLNVNSTVATDSVDLAIKEGSTQLQGFNVNALAAQVQSAFGQVILIPSAGSHTYKITCARNGTGTVTVYSGASYPAFILVELI